MKGIAFAASLATLALPFAAKAQSPATSSITLSGEVENACVLGDPDVAEMNLGDLTDDTGKLNAALVSAAISASASIPVAWCNAPSVITLNAAPMSLVTPPGYSTPSGFSRLITYTAALTGWSSSLSDRPTVGDAAKSASALAAHAADPLGIEVSLLSTLDAGGTVENAVFLEAGVYTATIVVGLSVQP